MEEEDRARRRGGATPGLSRSMTGRSARMVRFPSMEEARNNGVGETGLGLRPL